VKTVYLYGALAAEFGESFTLEVSSVAEAIRLLEANFPGKFVNAMRDRHFRVSRGRDSACILEQEVLLPSSAREIHITPVIQGAFKGAFGLLFGPGLLSGVFSPLGLPILGGAGGAAGAGAAGGIGGAFGGFGSLLLGFTVLGVVALISGALRPDEQAKATEEQKSFLFNGALNSSEQGGSVPLIYGQVIVGSVVISGGISVEEQVG
jgi:predicted phage tail protein